MQEELLEQALLDKRLLEAKILEFYEILDNDRDIYFYNQDIILQYYKHFNLITRTSGKI